MSQTLGKIANGHYFCFWIIFFHKAIKYILIMLNLVLMVKLSEDKTRFHIQIN